MTRVAVDRELVETVMRRYRLPSRRAAADFALRQLVGNPMSKEEVLAMEGTGWGDDLSMMRDEPIEHTRPD